MSACSATVTSRFCQEFLFVRATVSLANGGMRGCIDRCMSVN